MDILLTSCFDKKGQIFIIIFNILKLKFFSLLLKLIVNYYYIYFYTSI